VQPDFNAHVIYTVGIIFINQFPSILSTELGILSVLKEVALDLGHGQLLHREAVGKLQGVLVVRI